MTNKELLARLEAMRQELLQLALDVDMAKDDQDGNRQVLMVNSNRVLEAMDKLAADLYSFGTEW